MSSRDGHVGQREGSGVTVAARDKGTSGNASGIRRLVIVESPAKARTIAGYLGARLRRRGLASGTSATCRAAPPTSRPSTRASRGRGSGVDVDARLRAALRRQPREEAARSPSSRRCSRTPTSSTSPRTRTARARPSPGTCSRPSSPRSRSSGWCSTRSPSRRSARPPRTRATSTTTWSTRRRPAASSTGSTATRSRRCCGRRSCRGCRRAACSRWRPASSSSASASGWRSASAEYWDIAADLDAGADAQPPPFGARLRRRRRRPGRGRPRLRRRRAARRPTSVVRARRGRRPRPGRRARTAPRSTVGVGRGEAVHAPPYAPFMTSTLQQEAGRKLRFSSERTMRVAQRLYENGYITYMRTDSTTLSRVGDRRGPRAGRASSTAPSTSPDAAPVHPQGQERAGGARGDPAGRRRLPHPGRRCARELDARRVPALRADLAAHRRLADGRRARHHAERCGSPAPRRSGERVHLRRRRAARSRSPASSGLRGDASTSRPAARPTTPSAGCRNLDARASAVTATSSTPDGHSTNPPARYTEASLVKALEELGIGRPSTYASIIETIQDRGYVCKKGSALVPSWVAFAVIGLLEQHFGRLVDYDFTAAMEDELDADRRRRASSAPTGCTASTSAASTAPRARSRARAA